MAVVAFIDEVIEIVALILTHEHIQNPIPVEVMQQERMSSRMFYFEIFKNRNLGYRPSCTGLSKGKTITAAEFKPAPPAHRSGKSVNIRRSFPLYTGIPVIFQKIPRGKIEGYNIQISIPVN